MSDREQRAELEQLQAELRDARASLATVSEEKPPEQAALEDQLAAARARLATARARVQRLKADTAQLRDRLEPLFSELVAEKARTVGSPRPDRLAKRARADPGEIERKDESSLKGWVIFLVWQLLVIRFVYVAEGCNHY